MKKKLSQSVGLYKRREKDILRHFSKVGYSQEAVTDYGAACMIPLVVVYYYLWINGEEEAKEHMDRLAEYYEIEVDV